MAGPISSEQPVVINCNGAPIHGKISKLPLFIMHTNNSPSAVQHMSVIHQDLNRYSNILVHYLYPVWLHQIIPILYQYRQQYYKYKYWSIASL